jgi:hypothetical protein
MVVLSLLCGYWSRLWLWLWELMPQEYADDRLIFKLSSEDAVELDKLGEGFAGLAREFQNHLQQSGIESAGAQAKLFVTNLRTSSVEFELATLASLYLMAHAAVEGVVLWSEFYDRIKNGLSDLIRPNPA